MLIRMWAGPTSVEINVDLPQYTAPLVKCLNCDNAVAKADGVYNGPLPSPVVH